MHTVSKVLAGLVLALALLAAAPLAIAATDPPPESNGWPTCCGDPK
jgi:hypothetical protein